VRAARSPGEVAQQLRVCFVGKGRNADSNIHVRLTPYTLLSNALPHILVCTLFNRFQANEKLNRIYLPKSLNSVLYLVGYFRVFQRPPALLLFLGNGQSDWNAAKIYVLHIGIIHLIQENIFDFFSEPKF